MFNDAGAVIRGQLGPDEQLLWSAPPRGGITFRSEEIYLIPISLLWGGFAIFWEWMATTSGAGWFAEIWGIPFVAVGLYMIVGRFVCDAWSRSNTFYGLTNERAVIIRRAIPNDVRSVSLKSLGDVSVAVGNDRSGTITLGNSTPSNFGAALVPWGRSSYLSAPRFELIESANDVYDKIRGAQRDAQGS